MTSQHHDPVITSLEVHDLRFPTSADLAGSDAMNPDPDYSSVYVRLRTSDPSLIGNGMTFTIGRGNEIVAKAVEALGKFVVNRSIDSLWQNPGQFWREINSDSQLRWIGPEKGAMHLATAAVVNAVWDLFAKREQKPLWRLLVDMSPEQLVNCLDFRHVTDELTPEAAVEMLTEMQTSKADRIAEMERDGYPSYTTSAGWLGYDDDLLRELCRKNIAAGWNDFKIKVGRDLQDDIRRCRIIREEIGSDRRLMMDANQVWEVQDAIEWMSHLAEFDPYFIEEPTSPDDVLGHAKIAKGVAPIRVATGEHCHNRVMFKQFLSAGGMQVCQIDSCRLGGVNEVLLVILLAKRFGVPVCPHAGGIGLCEYVQHLSLFDDISVSGSLDGRFCEQADSLHEHFVNPIVMKNGRYQVPTASGYSIDMHEESVRDYAFPTGSVWQS